MFRTTAILLALLTFFILSPAKADQHRGLLNEFTGSFLPVHCGSVEFLTGQIMGSMLKERPFIIWKGVEGIYGLLTLNPSTRTSTVFLIRDGTACIITSGEETEIRLPRKENPDVAD